MEVGERIKQFIEESGINQADLARRCDVTPGYISQVVNLLRKPSMELIIKISERYHVPTDRFLRGSPGGEERTPVISDVHPDYLKGPKFGDYEFGLRITGEDGRFQVVPRYLKKVLDNVIEILNSDNRDVLRALRANVKIFLKAVRSKKSDDEDRGGD